ncbi:MAG: hypothetical protein NVS4B11_09100 [Ktedonobacteraceae bacterium]
MVNIAQSINIVISLSPEHKITTIAEVQPLDEGPLKMQSLFHYLDGNRFAVKNAKSYFEVNGFYPAFMERCKGMGIDIPHEAFIV